MFPKIDLNGIKAVLLDFDNTLYDYLPCHDYALTACHKKFIEIENISFEEFKKMYKDSQNNIKDQLPTQAAGHSRVLYFQNIFEKKFGRTVCDITLEFGELYWKSFFSKMVLRDGVIDFFRECKKLGIKICIVTDLTAKIQMEKIILLKIDKYIDYLITSEEAGAEKPDEKIFKLALSKLGVESRNAVVVGDSFHKDVSGAEKLGIKAIHLKEHDYELMDHKN